MVKSLPDLGWKHVRHADFGGVLNGLSELDGFFYRAQAGCDGGRPLLAFHRRNFESYATTRMIW